MLHFIIGLVVVFLLILFTLLVIEFVNGLEPLHCPIGKFPCFTPSDIHGLRANNNDN